MKMRTAIILVISAEVFVALLGVTNYGWSIEGLQATTRFSGRLSLFIFSFIFLLHQGKKETLALYLSNRYFLIFALAHGIHLCELLSYVYLAGIQLVPYRVAGGFLAYSLIFVMPWFQEQFDRKKIDDKRFQALGAVYLFYTWFIFFMTLLSRLNGSFPNAGGSHTQHVVVMGWICLILAIKLSSLFLKKSNQ